MGAFKRLTPAQRLVYRALRELGGEMTVTPDDARPLRALKRRGIIVYRRTLGVRVARLRVTKAERRVRARMGRWDRSYNGLNATGWIPEIEHRIR
jgi:hypothetical protein